jgi:ATP diphosphatase
LTPSHNLSTLLAIMAALRTPQTGCPWDLEQDFVSIAPYTIEEAYEVADAIARGDIHDLRDELGDLLLQVVFHARMAEEQGAFAFPDVVYAITSKLIRRHPHVFGDTRSLSPEQVKTLWQSIKDQEKRDRRQARAAQGLPDSEGRGLLDAIPLALPALTRAEKLQSKAATVGFDWQDVRLVLAKIREEADEIEEAIDSGEKDAISDEIGDLFFALTNLARHLSIDAEAALRGTNAKFERRFRFIEEQLAADGRTLFQFDLAEMDSLWNKAKRVEPR